MVDILTNMGCFIPFPGLPFTTTTVTFFIKEVFHLHELHNNIKFAQDPHLISWSEKHCSESSTCRSTSISANTCRTTGKAIGMLYPSSGSAPALIYPLKQYDYFYSTTLTLFITIHYTIYPNTDPQLWLSPPQIPHTIEQIPQPRQSPWYPEEVKTTQKDLQDSMLNSSRGDIKVWHAILLSLRHISIAQPCQ